MALCVQCIDQMTDDGTTSLLEENSDTIGLHLTNSMLVDAAADSLDAKSTKDGPERVVNDCLVSDTGYSGVLDNLSPQQTPAHDDAGSASNEPIVSDDPDPKDPQLLKLQEERARLEQECRELREQNTELYDAWQDTISELREMKNKTQETYLDTSQTMPDSDLAQQAQHLLHRIRTFVRSNSSSLGCAHVVPESNHNNSHNHRSHNDTTALNGHTPHYFHYLQSTTPETPAYRNYLKSPEEREMIVEAFLWRVLTGELFDGFLWLENAPRTVSNSIRKLRVFFRHYDSPDTTQEVAIQKWTLMTTQMVLDASSQIHHGKGSQTISTTPVSSLARWKRDTVADILDVIFDDPNHGGSTSTISYEKIERQLFEILGIAIDLDRNMARHQLARWEWRYFSMQESKNQDRREARLFFDSETMELIPGHPPRHHGGKSRGRGGGVGSKAVRLVITPGLVKRGEELDFDTERVFVKGAVYC